MSRNDSAPVDDIEQYIKNSYLENIHENTLRREESRDIIEATRILSKKKAISVRDEEIIRQKDVCWCLAMLCFLPLMPKPSEEEDLHQPSDTGEDESDGETDDLNSTSNQYLKEMEARRIVRREVIMHLSETNELPVKIPRSIFTSEQPSVLDFELEELTLRKIILSEGIDGTIAMIVNERQSNYTTRIKPLDPFKSICRELKTNSFGTIKRFPKPIISWLRIR